MIKNDNNEVQIKKMDRLFVVFLYGLIGVVFFGAGLLYAMNSHAAEKSKNRKTVVVYPKKSEVDFDGMKIQGEVRNPGEFYFQHRQEEKFDSLVKRRKNFQIEMLRDVVMTK